MSDFRVYLVVEAVAVVAEDLAECIVDFNAAARVLKAGAAEDALHLLTGVPHVSVAFVHSDPQGFGCSALGRALAEQGAQVIFMGCRADMAPEGTLLRLRSPFDSDTVQMVLESLSETCEQGQAPGLMRGA